MSTVNLTEFLLARIAEDMNVAVDCEVLVPLGYTWRSISWMHGANREHGRRWAPERVLAECEAKRKTIDRLNDHAWVGSYAVRDVLLSLLAAPYADHPDYRQEWAPTGHTG